MTTNGCAKSWDTWHFVSDDPDENYCKNPCSMRVVSDNA